MNELEDKIYDILEADTVIQGYTGWVSGLTGDKRIYHDWPPKQVPVSSDTPAYITMTFSAPGPIPMGEYVQNAQYPDEVAELNVWASAFHASGYSGGDLRGRIAERIMRLFWVNDNTEIDIVSIRSLPSWPPGFIVKKVVQESAVNMTELIEEGTRQITVWRKFMRLRFGPIYAKLMGE